MLRQVESENKNYDAFIIDARADNPEMIQFMESQVYTPLATLPLYQDSVLDVLMIKYSSLKEKEALILLARKILTLNQ